MRVKSIIYLITIICFLTNGDIQAQGFLNKLSKGIEKASKKVDNFLGADSTATSSKSKNVDVVSKIDEELINIPKTRSIMSLDDMQGAYNDRLRITQSERMNLRIDDLKNREGIYFDSFDNKYFSKGKTIYKGTTGRLETFLYIVDAAWLASEFLASYDTDGNLIDCVKIAHMYSADEEHGEAIIEGNFVVVSSVSEDYPVVLEYYKISPNLKFTNIPKWELE